MTEPHQGKTSLATLSIGQRIIQDGHRGTVRFLGPVPTTKGEWIGVEWDDPERGKHSGEHNETRYFECRFPGTGTFTRPSIKIQSGRTLLAELKERYVDDREMEDELFLGESKVKVEVYDFDRVKSKQRNLHLMKIVGLANTTVSTAADYAETHQTCPGIEDLDLSATLVSTWQDMAEICAPLDKLSILRISRNRFEPLTSPPSFGSCFANLRCLAVNRVFLSWDEMELLEPSMPNLEILQIGFNNMSELGKSVDQEESARVSTRKVRGFERLQDLHLEGNLFQDWNQILRLSALPRLRTLDLSENKIEKILGPEHPTTDFQTLTTIRLADNLIKDWSSVDQLGLYPALKSVWMAANPLMQVKVGSEGADETSSQDAVTADTRTHVIARMKNIQQLNGSDISSKSRMDAELYYLKHAAMATVGMEKSAVQALHPRFEELCEAHGHPDVSDESRKATSDVLKDRLISVRLVSKDTMDSPVKTLVERKILGTMTVKNLKNLAQKLVRVPAMRQQLCFETEDLDYKGVMIQVVMGDDLRQISYYDVKDGEEIFVLDKTKAK